MSTNINGNRDNVTSFAVLTVTNATNASPIVITTSASHGLATNDWVEIVVVGGNTAANGYWKINALSGTTFELVGSTGNGAYASGGNAIGVSLKPQVQIPADGDDLNAASVTAALQGLADRTQFLMAPPSLAWTGSAAYSPTIQIPPKSNYNSALIALISNDVSLQATDVANAATAAAAVAHITPAMVLVALDARSASGASMSLTHGGATTASVVVYSSTGAAIAVGDTVDFELSSVVGVAPGSSGGVAVNIQLQTDASGTWADVPNAVAGAKIIGTAGSFTDTNLIPFTIKGAFVAGFPGPFGFRLVFSSAVASSGDAITWNSTPWVATVRAYRAP